MNVLLVDDEPTICEVIRDFLEDQPGTTVACATTGEEGAQAIRDRRFDVALLDVMIPGLSGFALAEMAVTADLPVLLLSGHPLVNDTLSSFGWPYMPKPSPWPRCGRVWSMRWLRPGQISPR